jgi:type IV pilus assembly protein PilB
MPENNSISYRVLEALVSAGVITADQLAGARSDADDATAGSDLIARGLVTQDQLAGVLEDELGYPRVDLSSYAPDDEALAMMPASIARAFGVLPLFEIDGVLTVTVGSPVDIFRLDALGDELGLGMDAVLADRPAVDDALVTYYGSEDEPVVEADELEISASDFFDVGEDAPVVVDAADAPAVSEAEPAPQTVAEVVESSAPEGTPTIDLDVLAVADERKVALLVTDIIEQAIARGASRVHLLPYKNDFFLVFRIKGRLEKVASAPLSMQPPLVDGLKHYAKLGGVASGRPTLGRTHVEVEGKTFALTLSSVPTVAGQRMVVSIAPFKTQPKTLDELGMFEAESRALYTMVERGRGLLLLAGTISDGRSTTYYSLLNHAAQTGKTVYSVERSVEYEIPAVAQVVVSPSEPVNAAAYFTAGMRQDTDVMAIDSLQTAEDIHLAIEAAGLGKLVIATFAGADIVSAVSRMLQLGVEPVSLASALMLGVGQRALRTNCPNCSVEEHSPLAEKIPGAKRGITARRGTGCPNCGNTGFDGATAIFEMLPFTEAVRGVIASGGPADQIAAAARAAGMRSMVNAGLAHVESGLVSPEELDRVLRFSRQGA